MADSSVSQFVALQRELLASELKSEEEATPSSCSRKKKEDGEVTARVLRSLDIDQVSVGLYGRTVLTLATQHDSERLLPPHRFTTGDEVQIMSKKISDRQASGGVVCAVTETSISIALFSKNQPQEQDEIGIPPLTLVSKSSVDVHKKLIQALDELERHGTMHPVAGRIVEASFGTDQSNAVSSIAPTIRPFNERLDESQLEAISFSLTEGRCVSLIHGPPGTGKTSTVAELIQQAVQHFDFKVLVTAPSNVAVDNVLERIVQAEALPRKGAKKGDRKRIRAVRLGHPARIKDSILPYSLEALVQSADGSDIVSDVRQELNSFLQVMSNPKSRGADKRIAYKEIKALRKEVRTREQKVVDSLIQNAQVVLATTVGAANRILKDVKFDLVIIDEAAQALEASCWIPILRGERLVLAGDHCQLPPTIKSNDPAVQKELAKTLFERLMASSSDEADAISRMLKVQYRMHENIANWASTAMYHGDLQTHESVRNRKLSDLPNIESEQPALMLIDTAGCGMDEGVNAAGSRFNEGEAQIVVQHVKALIEQGLKPEQIAVISPYNGQVEILKTLLLPDIPKLEIRSVDGFQGGEREAVVLSLVRSNNNGVIGFLRDDRRLNVAVTRAKRHCAVICDTDTVSQHEFIRGLTDWMGEHGDYYSAIEFQLGDVEGDFQQAEEELSKLMAAQPTNAKAVSRATAKEKKPIRDHNETKNQQKALHALLDKCSAFASTGKAGDSMVLSSELSSNDRRVVHELATELGLEHKSEGVVGVNRHLKLVIPSPSVSAANQNSRSANDDHADTEVHEDDLAESSPNQESPNVAAFGILAESDSEDESEDSAPVQVPTNVLLGNLALERRQRQENATAQAAKPVERSSGTKKKRKNKGGKKLGGKQQSTNVVDDAPPDLDDMAFLDSQIQKVQNSHGRQVQGKGSYRTIINGVLLAKPKEEQRKKDPRAAEALNSKLKKAQENRRTKGRKKK